jgi:hypothetical protein
VRNPREPQVRVPLAKPKRLGPEHNPWYWHPNRAGVRKAPAFFSDRLHSEMGEELEVTWNPINQRWQIFTRAPRLNHPVCQGWKLLFVHNGPNGEYLPLDERVFARLYSASAAAHGSGKAYFQRIVDEMERDKARTDKQNLQDSIDIAMESFDHSRIKVGYGPSSGSKFSKYHA